MFNLLSVIKRGGMLLMIWPLMSILWEQFENCLEWLIQETLSYDLSSWPWRHLKPDRPFVDQLFYAFCSQSALKSRQGDNQYRKNDVFLAVLHYLFSHVCLFVFVTVSSTSGQMKDKVALCAEQSCRESKSGSFFFCRLVAGYLL